MNGLIDKVKGKAKQLEGALTGDRTRKVEGKLDVVKGNIKDAAEKVGDAAHKAVDAVTRTSKKM